MTRALLTISVLLSMSSAAGAIGYSDFPADLRLVLDKRIAELQAKGGICIAGRVTFSDGVAITGGSDVQVNRTSPADEALRVYAEGWFIAQTITSAYYAGPGRQMVLRAFRYDPLDVNITVLKDEITYVDYVMNRTPAENLAGVTGTVSDEKRRPFKGATVILGYPGANLGIGNCPMRSVTTSDNGQFSFVGVSSTEYRVIAQANEYAYHTASFTLPVGGNSVQDRILYPKRRVSFEYVYQPDGSLSFAGDALQTGFIDWLVQTGGVDFSQGRVESTVDIGSLRDLEMYQTQDAMWFASFYQNGYRNGVYDAGAVPFDSVTQANATGYSSGPPCVVGHVYVVKTYENHYAKFIVTSNERMFETILPGDPDPIEFVTYGLKVNLANVSGNSKLYAQNYPALPPGIRGAVVPRYLSLSGMSGTIFQAGLQFQYQDQEIAALGMSEDTLSVATSTDSGATWQLLPTSRDPANNTLTVSNQTALGWFAITDSGDRDGDGLIGFLDACPDTLPGKRIDATGCARPPPDYDKDGDVDLDDFGHLQACLAELAAIPTGCQDADLNGDTFVDQSDLALFLECAKGANQEPGC